MKKKQLAKLKQQFRPSFDVARQMLFDTIEKQAANNYQLPVKVYLHNQKTPEMAIELLSETTKEQVIAVPLDKNFNTVVKRIQRQEKDLLERFSDNLVSEIANYWLTPAPEETVAATTTPEVVEEVPATVETTSSDATATFKEAITAFPKFAVNETNEQFEIIEQAPKGDRLLATVSKTSVDTFAIETALERKYKLKLEVIPVIEAFAKTPLNER